MSGCQRVSDLSRRNGSRTNCLAGSIGFGGQRHRVNRTPTNLMGLTQPKGQEALIDTIGAWLDGELFAID